MKCEDRRQMATMNGVEQGTTNSDNRAQDILNDSFYVLENSPKKILFNIDENIM